MSTMALEDEVVMPTQEASIICVRHGPAHLTCGVYSKGKNQSYVQRDSIVKEFVGGLLTGTIRKKTANIWLTTI